MYGYNDQYDYKQDKEHKEKFKEYPKTLRIAEDERKDHDGCVTKMLSLSRNSSFRSSYLDGKNSLIPYCIGVGLLVSILLWFIGQFTLQNQVLLV